MHAYIHVERNHGFWSNNSSSSLLPSTNPSSPTKSEFIRSKYQMLSFVHKLPCRDDDGVTTKDLSKVSVPASSGQRSRG